MVERAWWAWLLVAVLVAVCLVMILGEIAATRSEATAL